MPDSHRRHQEWTPGRIISWAEKTGPATAKLAQGILQSRPHPEQGYRSCLGIVWLGDRYGAERVEAACQRALAVCAFSYRSVESILKTGLDRQPLPADRPVRVHRRHQNLRGPDYYRFEEKKVADQRHRRRPLQAQPARHGPRPHGAA